MMNWKVLANKLLTVQNILWAYSCPGLLSLRVEIPLFFLEPRVSPLSGRVCLLPRALLTCAPNTRERWALLGQRKGTPRRGTYGFGRQATALVPEVEQAWGVPWDLVLFAVVSDASSPSPSLMKDADVFREEVQLELDSTLGTQGGTCSQNPAKLKEVFVHRSCPAVTVPPRQMSANLFSSEDTRGCVCWGGGAVEWAGGDTKEKARLALTTGASAQGAPAQRVSAPAAPCTALERHVLGEYLCNKVMNIPLWWYRQEMRLIFFFFFWREGADGVLRLRDSVWFLNRWGTYF